MNDKTKVFLAATACAIAFAGSYSALDSLLYGPTPQKAPDICAEGVSREYLPAADIFDIAPETEPETEAETEGKADESASAPLHSEAPEETAEPTETIAEPTETIAETEPTLLGEFELTAYCACPACCGEWADGLTYTGTKATAGRTIAVDPDVIPLGSTVYINGSPYVAEDIGGGVKGNHIDVYFDTHQDALEFGVQYAEISIEN